MRGAVALLFLRRELRRRAAAFFGVALIVAIGGGVTIGSLVAAYRTDHVYESYVRDADVTDLVINPSLSTGAMDKAIRRLPGVRAVHSDSLFVATVSITGQTTAGKLLATDRFLQVRGSSDGRYEAVDRPVVTDGEFAHGDHEVFVSEDYRKDLEKTLGRALAVGDTIDVAFWKAGPDSEALAPETVVDPIGVEHLRIAGFGRLPDEVLPDELYARQRMVVSPDVARRYQCEGDLRPDMTAEAAVAAGFPPGCSRSYQYYSLDLDNRPGNRLAIRRAFARAAAELTKDIPSQLQSDAVSYFYISQDRADLDRAVGHVTQPTVTALTVLGIVAGIATLTTIGLGIARILRRNDDEQRALRAMGAGPGLRAMVGSAPPLAATMAGLAGAVVIGFALSIVGPAGSVRAVAPSAGFALPARVVLPTVAVLAVALAVITGLLAWSSAHRASRPIERRERRSWASRTLGAHGRPAPAQGISAALSLNRSSGAAVVLAGSVIAVAAVVAAMLFVTNLTTLVQDPVRYGWPWDVAALTNVGYGNTNPKAVAKTLDHNPAVTDYALFAFDPSSNIAGRPVTTIYGFPGAETTTLPLVEGRQAERPGEAVLGASTADALGVTVGDRVPVRSQVPGVKTLKVVGIGVLPSLGPFLSDRTGPGTGAFALINLDPANPEYQWPAALTAIRLKPSVDAKAFASRNHKAILGWDVVGQPPNVLTAPVRPPEIINAEGLRTGPLALGALLALGLAIGLACSIGVSVRDRRRELAILRSLGFSGRNLRATVAWQAVATIAVGLVIGIPLGLVGGRFAWESFARQLGVVPDAEISVAWLAVVIAGSLAVALLAAWSPARTAARITPSTALHDTP
jgi:ribosomal protein L13E